MNITQALHAAAALGLDRLDAQLLLLHSLSRAPHDRAWLLAHDRDALDDAAQARFFALTQRRAAGEPLAYLTGEHEFFGLTLQVDARVLDPRPDTEILVEWALECVSHRREESGGQPLRIADLGTGSGAIALALQAQRPDAQVLAVDASADALTVARANAERLRLGAQFQQGDWLAGITEVFDLIVSNPPYIAEGDPHLAALAHEPRMALTSGADGLDAIRSIVRQAPACLKPGGWLLLEHGWDQAAAVRALLAQTGFIDVQSRPDLAGIERCSGARWPLRKQPSPGQ